ncbi:hypothetical protein BC835DRAFT_1414423 [Cytidiella melzeri]|nr:hypothetical protein BC835DRAFT_1414423 [Cytidiella melzeri]
MAQPNFVHVPQRAFQAPITFVQNNSAFFTTNGGAEIGININAACLGQLDQLDLADQPCMMFQNTRISIRILWPDLPEWKFVNMMVCDNTANNNPYTYRKLANTLALRIQKFYEEMMTRDPPVAPEYPGWVLHNIDFNRLYLTELRHVSTGSWQPVLYYR